MRRLWSQHVAATTFATSRYSICVRKYGVQIPNPKYAKYYEWKGKGAKVIH